MSLPNCTGSGVAIAVGADVKERHPDLACPVCGRLLGMRVIYGGAAAKKLDAPAAAKVPPHHRRREGQAP